MGGPARALSGATLDKPSATAPAVCWHRIVHQHDQNEQLCQLQIKGLLRHWQQVLHLHENRRGKREGGGARGVLTRRLAAAAPWTRVAKKHCSSNKHATAYANFGQAQAACAGNAACLGVYDSACDGRAPYYMCKAGFALSTSSSSCVYACTSSSSCEIGRPSQLQSRTHGSW